ncbi:MAG: TonB-dependent receptor [Roseateles depolymerans]|uniref:TonB-dependent receptor n=1 Tax=Roseateles depolymerans TaxID=76731 RepID=A0A2W5DXA0_9BURK|nr:MAG: TonB-dependent receptor [Roseateles depolymerans]
MGRHPHAVSAAIAALIASLGNAQAAEVSNTTLDRVEVTAQRRLESAQDVGVALSVLNGDELKARGVTDVNKLQQQVPSLEIEPAFGSGQPQFRIRGIGFQDYGANNASPVGVYLDEVGYAFPVQTQGLLFDLDRVEVLRGPQGTLYGKNTTAGAINLISKRPTKQTEYGLSLGAGSFGATQAQGYLSGSLSEALRGRVSVASERGGAWQTNRATGEKLGDKRIDAVRGQLELDVTPDLKAHLSLSHNQDRSDAQGLYLFTARPKAGEPADTSRRATGWGLAPDFAQSLGLAADARPGRDNRATNVALTLNWDLGATRLTSITAHQNFSRHELGDWDGTAVNHSDVYWQDKARITTQELRLASAPSNNFNWLAGVYYAKETLDEDWHTDFRKDYGLITRTRYGQDGKTWALFGQADQALAPGLKLVGGLRWEHERRSLHDFATSTTPVVAGLGVNGAAASLDGSHASGRLALEYQPAGPGQLFYGSVSRGIKSGGITAHNTFNTLALTPFQPEKLIAYEAGYKADLGSLRLSAAIFHYDYRDQQFQDVTTSPTGALIGKIINISRSTLNGGEFELQWRPAAGLTLTQSLGWKDGKFKSFDSPLLGDLSGHHQFFPKLSYGGSASYAWSAAGWDWKLAGDYSYRSRAPSWLNRLNVDGGQIYDIPAYWLANARVELAPSNSPWQATLGVRNLFNRDYDLTRNFFGNRPSTADDLNVAAAGEPRSVTLTLSYTY